MTTNRINQMENIQNEALTLFKKKNSDYGDAFASYGTVGVMVRMSDKLNRFVNIHGNHISLVNDETLRDTLIDLHNYAAMAIMLLDENKKDNEDRKNEERKNEDRKNEDRKNEDRKTEMEKQLYLIEPNMPIY